MCHRLHLHSTAHGCVIGFTSIAQPMDVSDNPPFKAMMADLLGRMEKGNQCQDSTSQCHTALQKTNYQLGLCFWESVLRCPWLAHSQPIYEELLASLFPTCPRASCWQLIPDLSMRSCWQLPDLSLGNWWLAHSQLVSEQLLVSLFQICGISNNLDSMEDGLN